MKKNFNNFLMIFQSQRINQANRQSFCFLTVTKTNFKGGSIAQWIAYLHLDPASNHEFFSEKISDVAVIIDSAKLNN